MKIKILYLSIFIAISLLVSSCNKEEVVPAPVIKVFANDAEQLSDTLKITRSTTVSYRFEVNASTTITSLRSVNYDISVPGKKTGNEIQVGGLSNSTTENVKGIIKPTVNTELMLIVNDLAGNETAKSLVLILQ
jgi:hypothetical protein